MSTTAKSRIPGRAIDGHPGTYTRGFKHQAIREVRYTEDEQRVAQQLGIAQAKRYAMGTATILVTREPAGPNGEPLWHLSISHPHRYPTWDEIKFARYSLLPMDIVAAILLPPPDQYVNVPSQDNVFHVWQVIDARQAWTEP